MKIYGECGEWLRNKNIFENMRWMTGEWKYIENGVNEEWMKNIENEVNDWGIKVYWEWDEWLVNENKLRMRWMTSEWKYIENEITGGWKYVENEVNDSWMKTYWQWDK